MSTAPGRLGWAALLVGAAALPMLPGAADGLSLPLRQASGAVAALLLRCSGFPADCVGLHLGHGDRLLYLDPACAGLRRLWVCGLLAVALAWRWRLRPAANGLLLLLVAASSLAGNALRYASIFVLEHRLLVGRSLPFGLSRAGVHEGLGVLVFVLEAAVVAWLAEWLGHASSSQRTAISRTRPDPGTPAA